MIPTGTEKHHFDITVIKEETEIPPKLRSTLMYRNVTREFYTEDNMDDFYVLREKVAFFLEDFGMNPASIKIFVLMTSAQDYWDKTILFFPRYKVKIYVFPRYEASLFCSSIPNDPEQKNAANRTDST